MSIVRGFFMFWWDFLVGDNWEVAAGVVVALFVLWLVQKGVGGQPWLGPLGFLLVVVVVGASLLRGSDTRA